MKLFIETFKNKRKKWQFRVKAKNGRIIVHSEEYSNKSAMIKSALKFLLHESIKWKGEV